MDATDGQLVEQCRKELPYVTLAYEQLVRRYDPVVFSTCLRYLSHQQEAEDAAQDVFLRVFHGLKKFEGRSAFRTWLFRIVTNVCATRYKKLKQEREQWETLESHSHQNAPSDIAPSGRPDELHFTGPLGDALEQLADKDRQVLLLRHVAELSLQEISEALELNLSAAKMRLVRAQQRLKDTFDKTSGKKPKNQR